MFNFFKENKFDEKLSSDCSIEEKLNEMVKINPEALVITDLNLKIIKASSKAAALCGSKKSSDLIGKTLPKYIASFEIPRIMKMIKGFLKVGKVDNLEVKLKKINNDLYDGLISARIIHYKNHPKYIISAIRDISEFKRIQEKNQEGAQLYNLLKNNKDIGYFKYDKSMRLIDVNKKILDFFKVKEKDILNKKMFKLNFLLPKEKIVALKHVNDLLSGKQKFVTENYHFKNYSGKLAKTIVSSVPYYKKDKIHGVINFVYDLTSQEKLKKQLSQSENQYRSLFENTSDLLVILDDYGKIIDINNSVKKNLGYEKDEVLGKNIGNFIHPSDLPKAFRYLLLDMSGKTSPKTILHTRKKDKTYVPLEFAEGSVKIKDINGKIKYAMYSGRDIEDRVNAENKVAESKQLIRETFDALEDAIFILNADKNPKIINTNLAVEKMFGYKTDKIIGKDTSFLHVDSKHLKLFREVLYDDVKKHKKMSDFEFEMKKKDGTVFPTEHSVIPIYNNSNIMTGWISVVRDITQIKKIQDKIKSTSELNKQIIDQSPLGIYIANKKGIVEYANQAYLKIEEVPKNKFINKNILKDKHLIKLGVTKIIKQALNGKNITSDVIRHTNYKGKVTYRKKIIIPVKEKQEIKAVVIVQDLTKYKRSEEIINQTNEQLKVFTTKLQKEIVKREKDKRRLKEDEERFKAIINNTSDALFVHEITKNKMPGKFIEVNEVAVNRYGYSKKEFLTMSPQKLDDPKVARKQMPQVMKNLFEKGRILFETVHVTKDGNKIPVEINATLFNYDGRQMILSVARDISTRKKTETDLKEKVDELERMNKLMIGRELELAKMKKTINTLQERIKQDEKKK